MYIRSMLTIKNGATRDCPFAVANIVSFPCTSTVYRYTDRYTIDEHRILEFCIRSKWISFERKQECLDIPEYDDSRGHILGTEFCMMVNVSISSYGGYETYYCVTKRKGIRPESVIYINVKHFLITTFMSTYSICVERLYRESTGCKVYDARKRVSHNLMREWQNKHRGHDLNNGKSAHIEYMSIYHAQTHSSD